MFRYVTPPSISFNNPVGEKKEKERENRNQNVIQCTVENHQAFIFYFFAHWSRNRHCVGHLTSRTDDFNLQLIIIGDMEESSSFH